MESPRQAWRLLLSFQDTGDLDAWPTTSSRRSWDLGAAEVCGLSQYPKQKHRVRPIVTEWLGVLSVIISMALKCMVN